ncbi:putative 30S ribosomal subunit S4 [Trichoderma pleuroticola]
MRKPYRFYSLARPKLRQSWNKYNLYNLYRQTGREPQIRGTPTFFQQKWAAKAKTRSYHGEHIPEKKWVRLFSRRLLSAVDMPPEYLAAHDGSEQAAGRGSGLTTSNVTAETFSKVPALSTQERSRRRPLFGDVNKLLSDQFNNMTPYMQMTFAPLERRLDTAVFRALFASSVRQARQFVIHGAVTVNGKKMVHPSYQLNPGDMFQVDIEKVMYGTGVQKAAEAHKRLHENLEARQKKADKALQNAVKKLGGNATAEQAATKGETEGEKPEAEAEAAEGEAAASEDAGSLTPEAQWKLNNRALKFLLKDVKKLLKNNPKELTAKEKKQLRLFRADAKRFLSHPEKSEADVVELIDELQLQMKSHELMRESFEKLDLKEGQAQGQVENGAEAEAEAVEATSKEGEAQPVVNREREVEKGLEGLSDEQKTKAKRIIGDARLSKDEMRKLARLLQIDEENPVDDSKPYATPWRPRPYMSAFAFIPRYLEVNPNICAAVYLRHPVARKGMAEVPTPFSYLTSQLTHNWYLERG